MARIHHVMMHMNYSNFEKSRELEKAYGAYEGVSSNDNGIEGIYHTLYEYGWKCLSFLLLTVYLSTIHTAIIFVFIISALIYLYFSFKENQIDLENIDSSYQLKRKLVYYTYDISDISYGKEKRIYRFSDNIRKMYEKILEEYSNLLNHIQGKKIKVQILKSCISIIKYLLVLLFLMISYLNGCKIDKIIAFLTIGFTYSDLIDQLMNDGIKLLQDIEIAKKTLILIDEEENVDAKESISKITEIEFRDVTFQYEKDKPVLYHCSFRIHKGESIALLGLNGAGKTTLTKLLLGLYQPISGEILINGKKLNTINQQEYLQRISYTEQETHLISMRICDFISGNIKGYQKEKVWECLKKVNLYDKIHALPHGIESTMTKYLDKDGIEFSGGEMQKLYIARALYHENTDLYIFDEPTSALDYQSEQEIYHQFHTISQGQISIFISHKLRTTEFCDRILVIKDGKIVEDGTQQQLLIAKSHYYELIQAEKNVGNEHES